MRLVEGPGANLTILTQTLLIVTERKSDMNPIMTVSSLLVDQGLITDAADESEAPRTQTCFGEGPAREPPSPQPVARLTAWRPSVFSFPRPPATLNSSQQPTPRNHQSHLLLFFCP